MKRVLYCISVFIALNLFIGISYAQMVPYGQIQSDVYYRIQPDAYYSDVSIKIKEVTLDQSTLANETKIKCDVLYQGLEYPNMILYANPGSLTQLILAGHLATVCLGTQKSYLCNVNLYNGKYIIEKITI